MNHISSPSESGSSPDPAEPYRLSSPETLETFLDLQIRELELREKELQFSQQQLALQKLVDAQDFEYAKSTLLVDSADQKGTSRPREKCNEIWLSPGDHASPHHGLSDLLLTAP
jgi:hypothetical protein